MVVKTAKYFGFLSVPWVLLDVTARSSFVLQMGLQFALQQQKKQQTRKTSTAVRSGQARRLRRGPRFQSEHAVTHHCPHLNPLTSVWAIPYTQKLAPVTQALVPYPGNREHPRGVLRPYLCTCLSAACLPVCLCYASYDTTLRPQAHARGVLVNIRAPVCLPVCFLPQGGATATPSAYAQYSTSTETQS